MAMKTAKFISAGTRVKVAKPVQVPTSSTWDDDGGRCSTPVKKRLQQMFFRGDKRISGEVVYIGSEDIRVRLKNKGLVKVLIRDAAGSMITITAPTENLKAE